MTQTPTIGIEEELHIVDPDTRRARNLCSEICRKFGTSDFGTVKPELFESIIETQTRICADVQEAEKCLVNNRRRVIEAARGLGARIIAASTHPLSNWMDSDVVDNPRFKQLIEDWKYVARSNTICSLHIHLGMSSPHQSSDAFQFLRNFLPLFLALSTSSPFHNGRATGLKSTRTVTYRRLPLTGVPPCFKSVSEYDRVVNTYVDEKLIPDNRSVWWDIRHHPVYSTLEIRVFDLPVSVKDVVALVAFLQAIAVRRMQECQSQPRIPRMRTEQLDLHKLLAARYGLDAELLHWSGQGRATVRDQLNDALEYVDGVVDELGLRHHLEQLLKIARTGTSADHQLHIYEQSGRQADKVVDWLIEETERSCESS